MTRLRGGSTFLHLATALATGAHAGQTRKYTGEPYVSHCTAVCSLVASVWPEDYVTLAAAMLHDSLEDTALTYKDIVSMLPEEVGGLVVELTEPAGGLRSERIAMYAHQLYSASPEAQTVKVADIIDNLSTIIDRDPGFAPLYVSERIQLFTALTKAEASLHKRGELLLSAAIERLTKMKEVASDVRK